MTFECLPESTLYPSLSLSFITIDNDSALQLWNRGCCDRKDGSNTCPTDGNDHVSNDYYEIWRTRYYVSQSIMSTKNVQVHG